VIAALLLAAGAARRFGAPKLLQPLEGKPLVRWSAEWLCGSPVDEIVVIVPEEHDAIRRALAGLDVRFVVNPLADRGMSGSIARGLDALTPNVTAAVVALADEPMAGRAALLRVVERYEAGRQGGVAIVAPTYHGVSGHPVLFDRSTFDELRALTGDRGARVVVDRDPDRVAFVELNEAQPIDVDTPADLARLARHARQAQFISPSHSRLP
jgi:molybdenum cofactor cytidylyltransferase